MSVRQRAVPAAVGLLLFVTFGAISDPKFWTEWWFFVGLGVAVSTTFVEPFFTRAQDGLINGVGAIGAYWSADRADLLSMWSVFFVLACVVSIGSLLAALLRDGVIKALCNLISTRFGQAVLLGGAALFLEAATQLSVGMTDYGYLAVGAGLLIVALQVDWFRAFASRGGATCQAVDAVSPSLLVVEGVSNHLEAGARVAISSMSGDVVDAGVVATLPGKQGPRAVLALPCDWRELATHFPREMRIASRPGVAQEIAGLAAAGTTAAGIEFDVIGTVRFGEPLVVLSASDEPVLYQVFDQRLAGTTYAVADGISTKATARQLGANENGVLRARQTLPKAHSAIVRLGAPLRATLPEGYHRIGVVKETEFPIGVAVDQAVRGHLAVLGMSGMGKTTLVNRLCIALGTTRPVVAVDVTGEYRQRLGYQPWAHGDYTSRGHWVHEPAGDPPHQARQLLTEFMTAASNDYNAGTANPRVLLLEECHSFIPEWNVATKGQQDDVSFSTRLIMQSRKFGLSFILVSQRTAVVSKSALSQCESYIVFRTVDDTSLSYIEGMAGSVARAVVPTLGRYEAMCFGPAFNAEAPLIVTLDTPVPPVAPALTPGAPPF